MPTKGPMFANVCLVENEMLQHKGIDRLHVQTMTFRTREMCDAFFELDAEAFVEQGSLRFEIAANRLQCRTISMPPIRIKGLEPMPFSK